MPWTTKKINDNSSVTYYKDADGKDIEPNWHQSEIIHCPNNRCYGMLLQSVYYHPMKCSKCGKLWMANTEFVEVETLS